MLTFIAILLLQSAHAHASLENTHEREREKLWLISVRNLNEFFSSFVVTICSCSCHSPCYDSLSSLFVCLHKYYGMKGFSGDIIIIITILRGR